MIAARDGDLIESPMIYRLAKPLVRRFLLGQAGQGRLGLVERPQSAGRRFPGRRQHRDLQVLHRFRRRQRHRICHPGRGLVQAGRSAFGRSGHRHARRSSPRPRPRTSASSSGWSGRRSTISSSPAMDQFTAGASRASRSISCSGTTSLDGQLLLQGRGRGGQAAVSGRLPRRLQADRARTGPSPTS